MLLQQVKARQRCLQLHMQIQTRLCMLVKQKWTLPLFHTLNRERLQFHNCLQNGYVLNILDELYTILKCSCFSLSPPVALFGVVASFLAGGVGGIHLDTEN